MNTETATAVCSYCQEPFLAERMVICCESFLLVIHPWCARALSQDLAKTFDSWYLAKYFAKPMASATE
jgi:hypothetical protein